MFHRSSVSTVIVAVIAALSVSCASKKKNTDVGADANGNMDPNVAAKDIGFDSSGSDSGKIAGLASVRFDYDSSTLSSDSRRQLAENAEWIKSHAGVTVQVEGHTDSRGSVEYNLALGERRAKSVKTYLSSLGVDAKRMTIISYGEEKPIDPADNESAFSKNRRANFVPLAQ